MNAAPKITVWIDGNPHDVRPGRHSGADLRALVSPPAVDLWLDVDDAQDEAISLDAVIAVTANMRFFTNRLITIFLDGVAYRVAAGVITEKELRALPKPPIGDNFTLFEDITDALDRRLSDNEIVEIHDGSRFIAVARHHHHDDDVSIIVNGTPRTVPAGLISFEALVKMEFPTPVGPNPDYTVTYRAGDPRHPEGTLVEGQSVKVREGMIFVVTGTDRS